MLIFFALCRLKTIDMVIRSTQGAEDVLNKYENQLRDVNKVPVNEKEAEAHQTQLQVSVIINIVCCFKYEHEIILKLHILHPRNCARKPRANRARLPAWKKSFRGLTR